MLYLANPSTQKHCFHYREPVNNLVQIVELDSGRQVSIGFGWGSAEKAKVVKQLEKQLERQESLMAELKGWF